LCTVLGLRCACATAAGARRNAPHFSDFVTVPIDSGVAELGQGTFSGPPSSIALPSPLLEFAYKKKSRDLRPTAKTLLAGGSSS
jgi:hypothetical protein